MMEVEVSESNKLAKQGSVTTKSAKAQDLTALIKEWRKISGTTKSEIEVREQTEKAVSEIILVADEASRLSWLKPGKLVYTYIKSLQTEKGAKPDLFEILSAHPDIPYQSSHLRNLYASYELWESFGGEGKAPKASISLFTLALNSRLTFFYKGQFLNKAIEENLSVRQLKEEIRKHLAACNETGDEEMPSICSANVWNAINGPLKRITAVISDLRLHPPEGDIPQKAVEELTILAAYVADLLKAYECQKESAA